MSNSNKSEYNSGYNSSYNSRDNTNNRVNNIGNTKSQMQSYQIDDKMLNRVDKKPYKMKYTTPSYYEKKKFGDNVSTMTFIQPIKDFEKNSEYLELVSIKQRYKDLLQRQYILLDGYQPFSDTSNK